VRGKEEPQGVYVGRRAQAVIHGVERGAEVRAACLGCGAGAEPGFLEADAMTPVGYKIRWG
jgi:hypothetical protein